VPFADRPGFRLFYDERGPDELGEATPVLLVMGLGMAGTAWFHQIPDLSRRHRVLWYDHRGVGQSGAPPEPWSVGAMAEDALALLEHVAIPRVHLVGVSMGGMIAQELALAARERVRSLALLASHPGGSRRGPSWRGIWHVLGAGLDRPARRRRHLERLLFPPEFLARCDRAWLEQTLTRDFGSLPPRRVLRAQLAATRHHDTRARLGALAGLPTLIVRPGLDLLVDSRASLALHAAIPGSRLVELPEAGHGLVRQSWQRLNPLLLEHFAAADG
jgi:pimeloyl-ACP methyl ester carboxylesterase